MFHVVVSIVKVNPPLWRQRQSCLWLWLSLCNETANGTDGVQLCSIHSINPSVEKDPNCLLLFLSIPLDIVGRCAQNPSG